VAVLLLVLAAWAEIVPPDYRTVLTEAAGDEVDRLARAEGPDAAAAFASRWMKTLGESARVSYEVGLAWRLAGDDLAARRFLDRAIELDGEFVAARYDRGEVRLAEGDIDGAAEDFAVVARLEPEAWPGWFRLADVAGRRGDREAFESNLLSALRYGFLVRVVAADPTWRGFLRDARIGPVLQRLVYVYQGEDVLRLLETPEAPE
jgi:tetratricopeptide (TPR) repeat protein